MSKLFKLKEWVTLDDAAKRLTVTLCELVTKADILRLALDEKLKCSIYLTEPLPARKCLVYQNFRKNHNEGKRFVAKLLGTQEISYSAYDSTEGDFLVSVPSISINLREGQEGLIEPPIHEVRGLYDFFMSTGFLEKQYAIEIGVNAEPSNYGDVIFLRSGQHWHFDKEQFNYYALENVEGFGTDTKLHDFSPLQFVPATKAQGAVIAIRTSELLRFEECLIDKNDEANLAGKSRVPDPVTHLQIDGAACYLAHEQWSDKSDRQTMIASLIACHKARGDDVIVDLENAETSYLILCVRLNSERQIQSHIDALIEEGALQFFQLPSMTPTANKEGSFVLRSELLDAIKNRKPIAQNAPSNKVDMVSDARIKQAKAEAAMQNNKGVKKLAAEELGIDRRKLGRWLDGYPPSKSPKGKPKGKVTLHGAWRNGFTTTHKLDD